MGIRPQDRTSNVLHGVKHMKVVIPVNGNVNETGDITYKLGCHQLQ